MKNRNKGFTLIELMFVIVILGIVVVGISPGVESLMTRNRSTAVTNDLLVAINYARSEAITRSTDVSMCRRTAPTGSQTCTQTEFDAGAAYCGCSSASGPTNDGWEDGWLVFADRGTAGQIDAGDTLLKVQAAVGGGFTIRGAGSFDDVITFESDGSIPGASGSLFLCASGTETASDSLRMKTARRIAISFTGRPRAATFEAGHDCQV